ncbi:MAG: SDR family oxidoreductase [Myxococcales bacterium]|nr:SDR family oxidoreductase [Myxococcales bacterium]MCB9671261.1 SDR family oxidoreductase [Alphaproteobacteria bacterium]
MRIAIVGSTGGTGRALVEQGLERGHEVVALARKPEAVGIQHDRLEVKAADVLDRRSLEAAIAGTDAVLSALGISGWPGFGQISLYSQGGGNLVDAMEASGPKRLLAVTSGGVEHDDPSFDWFYRWVLKPVLIQRAYDDMIRMEDRISRSKLTWTLVRPTKLLDTPPHPDGYRVSPKLAPPGGREIARSDLAGFMLDELESNTWVGKTPTLAY